MVSSEAAALSALSSAGIEVGGWLPNFHVPDVLARFRVTVHIPRRPYVEALPGIPTIRPFEALACGIPLVSAPWDDAEHLFAPGQDFLVAGTGAEMAERLQKDPHPLVRRAHQAIAKVGDENTLLKLRLDILSGGGAGPLRA